ncbi:hypothetical protein [Streptacidiphilus cavernicola]|uniref:Agenet domain-containing protein n=1 Tax=Streptacidiphilus cavernicola TaxID=3342716 RepID=A0ABV6VMX4_9ACTN
MTPHQHHEGPTPDAGADCGNSDSTGDAAEHRVPAWQPPQAEVRRVYRPVEIRSPDGAWQLGRITAWWQPAEGRPWCRVTAIGDGGRSRWLPADSESLVPLPSAGI